MATAQLNGIFLMGLSWSLLGFCCDFLSDRLRLSGISSERNTRGVIFFFFFRPPQPPENSASRCHQESMAGKSPGHGSFDENAGYHNSELVKGWLFPHLKDADICRYMQI